MKKSLDLSNSVSILGPEYSYSHLLAQKACPNKKFLFCNNIEEVFKLVHEGKIKTGLVPIENMLNGSVRESILSLKKYKIKINNLYNFPIHHCFASKTKNFKKIISHPQAIAQCLKFLDSYRQKGIEIVETTSTSKALEMASLDKDYAAVGSFSGAKHFGLSIIKDKIENNNNNVTSFILISKKESVIKSKYNIRTSILVIPAQDHPGLLYEVLFSFKKNNINLTKIESIPTGEKIGEYIFYIEFDGNLSEDSVHMALSTIKALYNIYVLGSYEVENIA
jgi:prephenate dehydratase